MSDNAQWIPAPTQTISDLGQLNAFGDPVLSQIIRILQIQEATASGLGRMLDLPEASVMESVQRLIELVLVRPIGSTSGKNGSEASYRAVAKMFNLKPEPRDAGIVTSSVAVAMLETLSREILTSVEMWPGQTMYSEGRRARIPVNRALEFNDRLVELLREFWGDAVEPVEEDPNDPLLSFAGVWYRVPE